MRDEAIVVWSVCLGVVVVGVVDVVVVVVVDVGGKRCKNGTWTEIEIYSVHRRVSVAWHSGQTHVAEGERVGA